jgi:hypothetical protein
MFRRDASAHMVGRHGSRQRTWLLYPKLVNRLPGSRRRSKFALANHQTFYGLPPTAAARGAAHKQVTGPQSSDDGRAKVSRETSFRADGIGVCRRSSGGAEVTAGDAVRMIARGALTRRLIRLRIL